MSLKKDHVYVEVYQSKSGGYSLAICNDSGGDRVAGGKISGTALVAQFEVSAESLIVAINNNQGE